MQTHLFKCLVSTTRLLSQSSVSTLDMALVANSAPATLGGMAAPATPHADTFGSVPGEFLTFLESIDVANALSGEQYVKIAECFRSHVGSCFGVFLVCCACRLQAHDICSQDELIGVEWADLETGGSM